MYKNYNMTQLTLPIETSVRIPQMIFHDMLMKLLKRYLIANSMNSDIIVAQHPIIQK
ncbi:putative transposase [Staphylococcus aureus]|nr:putative transposase [Staphylococcus aureus]